MRRQGPGGTVHAAAAPPRDRSLAGLFDPGSITVVGASADPAKWGHTMARRALEACGDRPVLLVNRRSVEVRGRRTHATLAQARDELGGPLDLVVVCVPAVELVPTVAAAVDAGARSLVVITAGLAETGERGMRAEQEVLRLTRAAGAVLVGPNCLGLVDTGASLQLSHDLLPAGGVTVLSQSGNVVIDLAALLADRGLGIARFVSLGNQADLTVVDVMRSSVEHVGTRAVAVYAEDLVDGRAFMGAARQLVEVGKPVVLLAPGRSEAAVRSAVSHTGSLATAYRVVEAACAAVGAHRVDNPTELADLLQGLLPGRRMAGPRVAVVTDGGGHGAIAADALAARRLETSPLADSTRAGLHTFLWENSTVTNPVDLAGAGEQDLSSYARAAQSLLAAEEVDGVLMTGYFGGYSAQQGELAPAELAAARSLADAVRAQRKPLVVHTIFPHGPSGRLLREAGIPVHRDVDRAAAVLAALQHRLAAEPADLSLPPPAPPVSDTSYDAARQLFARAGVPFPRACLVRDEAELEDAFAALPFPLALKALGRQHKSDGGGVVLGLQDADSVRSCYAALVARLAPPVVSVESCVDTSTGVELLVGSVQDPRFGPVLMVGLGGVLAEVLEDTVVAIGPVSPVVARELLLSLRGAPLLTGTRGREPVDLAAAARAVAAVSRLAAEHPELVELELNPLLVTASGVLALDARIVTGTVQRSATSAR